MTLARADRRAACGLDTGGALTVATMNLHCGVGSRGQAFDVGATIKRMDANVIVLQETWLPDDGPDPVLDVARALGLELFRVHLRAAASPWRLGIPVDTGPGRLGMAILCGLPTTDYDVIDLGRAPRDSVRRYAQVLTVRLPGGSPLRIAATHLTHRYASPVQLRRLVRYLRRQPLPTLIVGDLNMPGLIAGKIRGYRRAVRGRTWPARWPLVQLDHILASSNLRRLSGRVLPPAGSDHRALLAELAPVTSQR